MTNLNTGDAPGGVASAPASAMAYRAAKTGRTRRRAMLLIALGEFLDGYDLISMGGALLQLRSLFRLTPSDTGLLGAAAFFGAAIGLFIAGDISDRIGRRVVFVYNFWLFAALSLLSAFVTDYTQLFVIRVFLGIAVGADIASSMTYLAELSPSHSRGRWTGALPQISWTLGALASLGVALALTLMLGDNAWRWLFGLGAIPAIIILLGRKTLPESPHWLMRQGRVAEAHQSMRLLGMDMDEVTPQEGYGLENTVERKKKSGSYLDIFRAPYTRQALLAILIIGLTPLINSPASVAAPYVMRYVGGLTPIASLEGGMLIWIGGLLGSIIALLTIDRLGRIWSTVISCWGCALCLVGLTHWVGTPWIFVATYFVYGVLIFFGASSFWCLPSELLPTHLRARAQGVGNGMARLMIGITTWLVPTGIALIGFSPTFKGLAALGIVLGAYALTGLKFEPKGLTLDALSDDGLPPP